MGVEGNLQLQSCHSGYVCTTACDGVSAMSQITSICRIELCKSSRTKAFIAHAHAKMLANQTSVLPLQAGDCGKARADWIMNVFSI